MKYFVVALHFYQPPNQDLHITKSVLDFCYLPLLRLLDKKEAYSIACNFSGSLLEQLEKLQAEEFFRLVKKLIAEGKIEMMHSAMYHPLLPLISDEMISRQIRHNLNILERLIDHKKPHIFFPPELALDHHSLDQISDPYIFVNEKSVGKGPLLEYGKQHLLVANQKLVNLLRAYPKTLELKTVFKYMKEEYPDEDLFILPNDAELFGHHYAERLQLLAEILDSKEVTCISPKQAIEQFSGIKKTVKKIELGSWQNTDRINLWTNNRLQRKYLKLARFVTELTTGKGNEVIYSFLDKGWSSCYVYWLSNWPWWYPDIVEHGAKNLIQSVRATADLSNDQKISAEKMYFKLLSEIWQYHWSSQVQENYEKFDRSHEKKLVTFEHL